MNNKIDLTRYLVNGGGDCSQETRMKIVDGEVVEVENTPDKLFSKTNGKTGDEVLLNLNSDDDQDIKLSNEAVDSKIRKRASSSSQDSDVIRPKKVRRFLHAIDTDSEEDQEDVKPSSSKYFNSLLEDSEEEDKTALSFAKSLTSRVTSILSSKHDVNFKMLKERNPNVAEDELKKAFTDADNDPFKAERILKQAKATKLAAGISPSIVKNKYADFISVLKKPDNNFIAGNHKVSMVSDKHKDTIPSTQQLSTDDEDEAKASTSRRTFPLSNFFSKPSALTLKPALENGKRPPVKNFPKQPKQKRRFLVDNSDEEDSNDSFINDDSLSEADEDELLSERVKRRKRKATKKDKGDVDELTAILDDSEGEYHEEEKLVASSSEEDEAGYSDHSDEKPKKRLQSAARTEKLAKLKENVLKFMNESSVHDLETIHGVSKKKADIIISLRPFESYDKMREALNNMKGVSDEMINNALEAMKSRDVVKDLMSQCQDMSAKITDSVAKLKEAQQPHLLNKDMQLKEYQLLGLNWLVLMHEKGINAILADEMGLGKTIQVIALLAFLKERRNNTGPHLIVVPASTLDNWDRELSLWCPKLDVLVYHGSMDERAEMREGIFKEKVKFEIMLTTYQMVFADDAKKLLKRTVFKYAIFDEAHMLKNMKTLRYTQLIKIRAVRRLLLTGTPLQNNLLELMSLLTFTMPNLFHAKSDEIKSMFSYNSFKATGNDVSKSSFEQERIDHAKKIMKPFILRRLKADVLKQLPKKEIVIKKCEMTKYQKSKYDSLVASYHDDVLQDITIIENVDENDEAQILKIENEARDKKKPDKEIGGKKGASMMMELRKAANHPLLLRNHYSDAKLKQMSKLMLKEPTHKDASAHLIFEDMQIMHDFELAQLCLKYNSLKKFRLNDSHILDSGKFKALDELLPSLKTKKAKVLIFSQFKLVLDIIEAYLDIRKHKFIRLDGSTRIEDRLDLIDDFNSPESETFVFLLTTRAGGVGINLTGASTAILHDIDFNPYNDKQAEDRCHRVGQTNDVTIYKLVSSDSIEEGMLQMANNKLKLGEDLCDSSARRAGKSSYIGFSNFTNQTLCHCRSSSEERHEESTTTGTWSMIAHTFIR